MKKYPTKEEIFQTIKQHPPPPLDIELITDWKITYYTKRWKNSSTKEKRKAIKILLEFLWYTKLPDTDLFKLKWKKSQSWNYNPDKHIITGTNTSIISALHELGHALYGHSELHACAYSISLFKTCFPKEYGRLKWEGHMLLKI